MARIIIAQVCARTGLQVSTGALITTAARQVPELHVRQLNLWMPDPEEEEDDDNAFEQCQEAAKRRCGNCCS